MAASEEKNPVDKAGRENIHEQYVRIDEGELLDVFFQAGALKPCCHEGTHRIVGIYHDTENRKVWAIVRAECNPPKEEPNPPQLSPHGFLRMVRDSMRGPVIPPL